MGESGRVFALGMSTWRTSECYRQHPGSCVPLTSTVILKGKSVLPDKLFFRESLKSRICSKANDVQLGVPCSSVILQREITTSGTRNSL